MGRYPHQSLMGLPSGGDLQRVRQAMASTDVWGLRHRRFSQLSGGERQRVLLAAALAQEPRVLLLDEPTRALDLKHQLQILETVFQQQKARRLTVILVTHDLNLAAWYCSHLAVLKNARLMAAGPVEKVFRVPLLEAVFDVPLKLSPSEDGGGQVVVDLSRYRATHGGKAPGNG